MEYFKNIFGLSYNNLKNIFFDGFNLDEHNLDEVKTLNEMIIKYKIKKRINGKIRLFGEKFFKKIEINV